MKEPRHGSEHRLARSLVAFGLLAALSLADASSQTEVAPTPSDETKRVEQFVRTLHFGGIPFDEARAFPNSVVPRLIEMLDDSGEEPHWANIVAVLGISGDPSAVEPLIDLLETGTPDESPDRVRARLTVPLALGYHANRSSDTRALTYLQSAAMSWTQDLSTFEALTVPDDTGISPMQRTTMIVLGLALSGSSSAGETLRSMTAVAEAQGLEVLPLEDGSKQANPFLAMAASALTEHARVSEMGLSRYYSESEPP